jgi:hypothetical protein
MGSLCPPIIFLKQIPLRSNPRSRMTPSGACFFPVAFAGHTHTIYTEPAPGLLAARALRVACQPLTNFSSRPRALPGFFITTC